MKFPNQIKYLMTWQLWYFPSCTLISRITYIIFSQPKIHAICIFGFLFSFSVSRKKYQEKVYFVWYSPIFNKTISWGLIRDFVDWLWQFVMIRVQSLLGIDMEKGGIALGWFHFVTFLIICSVFTVYGLRESVAKRE